MAVITAKLPPQLSPPTRRTSGYLLEVVNLSIEYSIDSQKVASVDGVTFSVSPGEIVGVLGESGCGKTTTALSLISLLPENARVVGGSVWFGGRNLLALPEAKLREVRGSEVSLVFQDSAVLNPVLRVGTQIAEVLRAHSRIKGKEARHQIYSLFEAIGLREVERIYDAYPHQLSGGQRQRIAFAQALICRPRLVIADEPTSSVDCATASQILAFIKTAARTDGTAFIVISHDPEVLSVADRVVVMYGGQVVENGPAGDVLANPLHPYTSALIQCSPRRAVAISSKAKRRRPYIPGDSPDPSEAVSGCAFAPRCPNRMPICDLYNPPLVDESKNHVVNREADRGTDHLVRCFKYGS